MLSTAAKVSVAGIAFHILALPVGLFVLARHGVKGLLPWGYFTLFNIVRIADYALRISAGSTDYGLLIDSTILSSVGVTFLVLAIQGMVHEATFEHVLSGKKKRNCHVVVLALHQLLTFTGMILLIVSATQLKALFTGEVDLSKLHESLVLLKVGYLILLHMAVADIILPLVMLIFRKRIPAFPERTILNATVASIPFLFVRTLYSVLLVFGVIGKDSGVEGDLKRFSDVHVIGNPLTWLGMAVIMEWAIVIICFGTGVWTSNAVRKPQVNKENIAESAAL